MGHKGMSFDAQNVKIITQYGEVTLRGPVKTEEEKKFIGKSARSRINPENVDNQLEVVGDSDKK
jgi:osmotically-inducible protein OsmY